MVRLSGIISINIRIFRKPKKIIFLVYSKLKLFFFPPKKKYFICPYERRRVDFLGNQ